MVSTAPKLRLWRLAWDRLATTRSPGPKFCGGDCSAISYAKLSLRHLSTVEGLKAHQSSTCLARLTAHSENKDEADLSVRRRGVLRSARWQGSAPASPPHLPGSAISIWRQPRHFYPASTMDWAWGGPRTCGPACPWGPRGVELISSLFVLAFGRWLRYCLCTRDTRLKRPRAPPNISKKKVKHGCCSACALQRAWRRHCRLDGPTMARHCEPGPRGGGRGPPFVGSGNSFQPKSFSA